MQSAKGNAKTGANCVLYVLRTWPVSLASRQGVSVFLAFSVICGSNISVRGREVYAVAALMGCNMHWSVLAPDNVQETKSP